MLDRVIRMIEDQVEIVKELTGENPSMLRINENLLIAMAKDPDFWQKPQFKTEIRSTAPILNKFHAQNCNTVLTVIPSTRTLGFTLE